MFYKLENHLPGKTLRRNGRGVALPLSLPPPPLPSGVDIRDAIMCLCIGRSCIEKKPNIYFALSNTALFSFHLSGLISYTQE
jgi:hypothetical protein